MKKQFLALLLVLGVMTLLQGCAAKIDQVGLQVQLVKLERKADGSLLASLLFSNPNVGSRNVAKSSHQLTLNGKLAGELDIVEPLGLPALQTATVPVTLKRASGAAEVAGSVSYQLASLLTLSVYDDNVQRYKTSSSGTVVVQ